MNRRRLQDPINFIETVQQVFFLDPVRDGLADILEGIFQSSPKDAPIKRVKS